MSVRALEPETFAVFSSKWALPIACALRGRIVRFGVLRAEHGDISQKMLSSSLKLLERRGLVVRRCYNVIPPRVEYSLTPVGEEVVDRVVQLAPLIARAHARWSPLDDTFAAV